jgi:lactose/L-arabinose transport system ATP-binding protein
VVEHLGATSYVYANSKGEQLVIEHEEGPAGFGDRLEVSIPGARTYLFDAAGMRLRPRTQGQHA